MLGLPGDRVQYFQVSTGRPETKLALEKDMHTKDIPFVEGLCFCCVCCCCEYKIEDHVNAPWQACCVPELKFRCLLRLKNAPPASRGRMCDLGPSRWTTVATPRDPANLSGQH